MRSKISCFNATLLRKNLTRFWPLWTVYAVIWLIAGPVQQFVTIFGASARYEITRAQIAGRSATALLETGTEFGMWMALVFGCLFAMVLYSYLYSARSIGMMHSFPIRREGLFLTNFLSGCVVFVVTLVVNALLIAAVQAAGGVLVWSRVGLWFLCAAGQMVFFYGFAVFCAMFTGQVLAVPVFYAAWNAVAFVLYQCVQSFAGMFLYGYSGDSIPAWIRWLTPVFQLRRSMYLTSRWDDNLMCDVDHQVLGLGTLAIYALVGVLFAAAALAVYRVRRSETAGDTVSISWARQVFRFGVGLCAALTLGQWLYQLLWSEFFWSSDGKPAMPLAILSMAVLGLVGFYGAEMLLCKSFRVFRSGWKGGALTVAIVVILGVGVELDILGVETRLPDASEVRSVEFQIGANGVVSGTVKDPATIQKFLEFHQTLIDGKKQEQSQENKARYLSDDEWQENWNTGWVNLTYILDGSRMGRGYTLTYQYDELEDPQSLVSQVEELVCDPAVQKASILEYWADITAQQLLENLVSGDMDYVRRVYSDGSYETGTYPFAEDEARAVLEAVYRDIDAGRAGRTLFTSDGWSQTYQNDLYFRCRTEGSQSDYDFTARISITPDYTETVAVLKELGIVSEARPLMTQKELNDLQEQGGEEPDLSATENYDGPRDEPAEGSATVEAEHSGTVVYENPSTGEQVMVIPPAGEGQEDA